MIVNTLLKRTTRFIILNNNKNSNYNNLVNLGLRNFNTSFKCFNDDKDKKINEKEKEEITPKLTRNPLDFNSMDRFDEPLENEQIKKDLKEQVKVENKGQEKESNSTENLKDNKNINKEGYDTIKKDKLAGNLSDWIQEGLEDGEGGDVKTYRKKSKLNTEQERTKPINVILLSAMGLALLGYTINNIAGPYTLEELKEHENWNNNDTIQQRAYNRYLSLKDYFFKPKYTKLLPPQNYPEGYSPYTLCLELDNTLIKLEWDKEHGFRIAKRPGLDRFLGLMSYLYELVLFTDMPEFNASLILSKLDPHELYFPVPHRLTREQTSRIDGKIVKDLNLLNRDLNKVIIMDPYEDHFSLNKENAILIPEWDGSPDDRYLLDILPFLETLYITNPKDVREVLTKYYGKDIPKVLNELEHEQRLKLAEKQKIGLRKFLGLETNTLPLTSMMKERLRIEEDFDSKREAMIKQAIEYREKELKEAMKMMEQSKLTVWDSIVRSFGGGVPADENKN